LGFAVNLTVRGDFCGSDSFCSLSILYSFKIDDPDNSGDYLVQHEQVLSNYSG